MSLLFDDSHSTESAFTIKDIPESGGPDIALLGKNIWATLASPTHRSLLPVCIQPLRKTRLSIRTELRALVCLAVFDEAVEHLAIPPRWCKTYPHIFSPDHVNRFPSLSITTTEPAFLTEVIVTALSAHAYQVARSQDSLLEDWFCKDNTVLRHGDVHTFGSKQLPINGHGSSLSFVSYAYRLDMLEPVLQGLARKGTTKFIVLLSQEEYLPSLSAVEGVAESDHECIEIDEAFLANSALSSIFGRPDHAYSTTGTRTAAIHNGIVGFPESPETCFRLMALTEPVDDTTDHCTLYVRTADLGKIGILNGDWAVARPSKTSNCRLVRIVANDGLVSTIGTVTGSPILLYNLFPDTSRTNKHISLHSSPFGSQQPAVPNALTVTIARVASPLSINRTYQPLFLQSLKAYFDSTKRLIKQGDIIAVSIDTEDITYHQEHGDSNGTGIEHDQGRKLAAFPSRSNDVVFFCITNVEHDVVKPRDTNPDMYVSSTVGELGCWVDSSVTRMVQTGVEHSWIPGVGTYFESVSSNSSRAFYSTLSRQESSHLLGPGSAFDKLLQLTSAASAHKAMDYKLNLSVLLKGARGTGKFTTAFWVAQRLGMHLLEARKDINCYEVVGENDAKTEGTLRAQFDKAKECSPCILLLRHIEALAQTTQVLESGKEPAIADALQECIEDMQKQWKITGYPVITLGTTSEPSRVPSSVLSSLKHEVSFEAPGEGERYELLECSLVDYTLAADVSTSSLAIQTAALVASDLVDLVARAKFASVERAIRASGGHPPHLAHAGIALSAADFEIALGTSRASYSESIGAPKIPNVSWDDVGGLAHVKSDILDTIQLPLEHPELFADGLKKRSGILLYGPPGTGKTLLAKAVATSCSLNFFSIKGPELLNMYIGESEANVRRVFQRARDAKPCVIFFDELDSVAPKRGNQGDSGGVMDRIVSQLLAELDGMSAGQGGADVFVIGATNRPDLLDPALLRPGRFDRMLYLGVSETHEAQTNILEALTRKFWLAPDLDLQEVAEQCPFNYTGADLYALCSDAMLNAMSRKAKGVDEKIAHLNNAPGSHNYPTPLTPQYFLAEMASPEDLSVLVSPEDFDRALKNLVPSVSQSEMDHYARIQRRFSRDEALLSPSSTYKPVA